MGRESFFIQGSIGLVWVMIWALTQCLSLHLYWPCSQIHLKSIRKKQSCLIRRLQLQKNVSLIVFLLLFLLQYLTLQMCSRVALCGCQSCLIGLSWTRVMQETDPSRYKAFLACVCWVIRGYTDSTVTAAHRLAACSAGSNHTPALLHLPIRQEETYCILRITT